jgi:hypothetical protein
MWVSSSMERGVDPRRAEGDLVSEVIDVGAVNGSLELHDSDSTMGARGASEGQPEARARFSQWRPVNAPPASWRGTFSSRLAAASDRSPQRKRGGFQIRQ